MNDQLSKIASILSKPEKSHKAFKRLNDQKQEVQNLWFKLFDAPKTQAEELYKQSTKLIKKNPYLNSLQTNLSLPTFNDDKQFQTVFDNSLNLTRQYNPNIFNFYCFLDHFVEYYPFYRKADKQLLKDFSNGLGVDNELIPKYSKSLVISRLYRRYLKIAKVFYLSNFLYLDETDFFSKLDNLKAFEIHILKTGNLNYKGLLNETINNA